MAAIVVKAQQLMPADDLSAADAIGVMQDDVKGLDFRMGGKEGFGLGYGRARGADIGGHVGFRLGQEGAKRSVRISSKLAIRRSIWRLVVAGLTSIMLWKGAIRLPRFRRPV